MHRDDKFPSASDIDNIISAEIPSIDDSPLLHAAVKNFMIHGPCGVLNRRSSCMVNNMCSKHFPKKYQQRTVVDDDGYLVYRRRDNGALVDKNGALLDNRFVVPYNPKLFLKYQAHTNVEWCNQSRSIKYLFKYINKGNDCITASITHNRNVGAKGNKEIIDEIKNYYDCRYISPCKAVWRIFSFDIHYRTPAVKRLMFHLPDEENVIFNDEDDIDDVLARLGTNESMFLAWMHCNKIDSNARQLTYAEFPSKFVWKQNLKAWKPRKKGFSVGRIHHVPVDSGEIYYLRILLNIMKGPTSYEEIRTVDEFVYNSFKDACYVLGLLDDDKEYVDGIIEANFWRSAKYLRSLYALLLMTNTLSKAEFVWEETWKYLSDDILHRQRTLLGIQDLRLSDEEIQNLTLIEVEIVLCQNGSSLQMHTSMPFPNMVNEFDTQNKLIRDELFYDRSMLLEEHRNLVSKMNSKQAHIYQQIMNSLSSNCGGVFFLYGHGGTGKTFIWKTLLRCKDQIVLNVASSGIASLLLDGGRTTHSRFAIPINNNEDSTCNIQAGSELAELIIKTDLIIWDEAPMMNKFCFEALDKSFRDLMISTNRINFELPFGGKIIVFGGDFRQILPVIQKCSRQDIVFATINSSYIYIWQFCKVLRLTKNMRLEIGAIHSSSNDVREFSEWVLKVGDGLVENDNDGEEIIKIPEECLLHDSDDLIALIVRNTYPSIMDSIFEPMYFEDRAILAPTHEIVEVINDYLLSIIDGEVREYFSSDRITTIDKDPNFNDDFYSTKFLNSIRCCGIPNHKLSLKVGVPIMLLRNINHSKGLCNGSRLQVTRLGNHVIKAKVMTGTNINHKLLIPRMILNTTYKRFHLCCKEDNFPLLSVLL